MPPIIQWSLSVQGKGMQEQHEQQEQFEQLKQQVVAIRRTRDSLCPYGPEIKRELMRHAVNEWEDSGLLDDISDRFGLEWGLLARWFREACEQESSVQSEG